MKLITAIVNKEDSRAVNSALVEAGFVVTKLSTTGGFLLAQNVTMLIGTEDEKVEQCIGIISEHSRQRKEMVPSGAGYGGISPAEIHPLEVTVGGATVFVSPVERFEKL
ncbi:cyclic-di-AMP receptor [Ruminococcaceae bacterium OttesenSCG-928-I18]|nr:cyclic-di-AMP receptor [Ruminococcaceae bacterium OttesenSCG-928-I18]